MTHVSCPSCRVRFDRALAAHLEECPLCGSPVDRSNRAGPLLGLWLFDADLVEPQASPQAATTPQAKAMAMLLPKGSS